MFCVCVLCWCVFFVGVCFVLVCVHLQARVCGVCVCVDMCECILYIWMCVQGEHLVHCLAWIYMWAGAGKAFGHLQQFLLLCNHHLIATVTKHYFGILLC